jgi:hypothetical protein
MDSKVFDVSKPGRISPNPTSRPIIPAQRQATADTTLTSDTTNMNAPTTPEPANTPIRISMEDEEHQVNVVSGPAGTAAPTPDTFHDTANASTEQATETPAQFFHAPEGATIPPHEMEELPKQQEVSTGGAGSNFTPLTTLLPDAGKNDEFSEPANHHIDNLPENHTGDPTWHKAEPLPMSKGTGPKRKKSKVLMWLLAVIILAVVGAYLAVDAGLIKSDIKLPFHIFNKQKMSTVTAPTPPAAKASNPISQPPTQSAVPAGFTKYEVADAGLSFAYPTAWGTPAVVKDPGFSKRGATNKTDGTYAYLVNFATNKDMQLALTSSKYLPATQGTKTPPYYGYLAWCTGTNDGKFYQQELKFSTVGGVDTPTTIACDVPMDPAPQKMDDSTISQTKVMSSGLVLGDVYAKNLTTNKDYPVLRVKDASMKSSDDIKKLLGTVKVTSATSGATSTTP